ncbi:hypothetical protein D3C76_993410 [compost metagenome]
MFGDARQQRADRLMGIDQFRQRRLQTPGRVDVTQQLHIPPTGAHIEIAGARGVAILAAMAAGEPEVQVVVGQQDVRDSGKQIGVLFFRPEQL